MASYGYTRLDLERDAIRLLRLQKGYSAEPLRCELFQAYLHEVDGIPYEALSYTWGDASSKREITVNQQPFSITANLNAALHALRSPHQDRLLWVDAICIDQASRTEKSHQVGQMRLVYKLAEQVIIWLGPSSEDSDLLMSLAKTLDIHASRTKAWEQEWKSIEVANGGPATEISSRAYAAMEKLLARPYFRRVWILQEVASARSAVVVCGAKRVPARTFAQMPALLGIEKVDTHVQAVLDIMPGPLRQKSWWTSNRDLKTLLRKFHSSQAGDERDRVYALLGLSSDSYCEKVIPPDYGADIGMVVQRTIYYLLFKDLGPAAPPAPHWGLDEFFDALEDLPNRVRGWYYTNEYHQQYKWYREMISPTPTSTTRSTSQGLSASLLIPAVCAGDKTVVQAILDRDDIDVNSGLAPGTTALAVALEHDKHDIATVLLAHKGLKLNENEAPHPLMIAIRREVHVEAMIARNDIDINGYYDEGGTWETPLTMAAKLGRQRVVELLVGREDVDVNLISKCTSDLSLSALAIASCKGDDVMVKTLLSHIDIDTTLDSGEVGVRDSPAWLAAQNGHTNIVRLLRSRYKDADVEGYMAIAKANESRIQDEMPWEYVFTSTMLPYSCSHLMSGEWNLGGDASRFSEPRFETRNTTYTGKSFT